MMEAGGRSAAELRGKAAICFEEARHAASMVTRDAFREAGGYFEWLALRAAECTCTQGIQGCAIHDPTARLVEPAVIVIEMPPEAPKTWVSVERAAGYLMREQKNYQPVANADVVIGRWGVERGDADGDDLYQTILIVSRDRFDRSAGVTLDGTRIDPGLFTASVPPAR